MRTRIRTSTAIDKPRVAGEGSAAGPEGGLTRWSVTGTHEQACPLAGRS
jgi:hypothetical protein